MKKINSIYDTYKFYTNQASKNFNTENIVVLLQVGSFYEIYDDGDSITKMENISSILNILLTKKNKNIQEVSKDNCLLIGFPCVALSKYLPLLIQNNYIVVIVEQYIDSNKKIQRRIKNIYTQTINDSFDVLNYSNSNWLMCIDFPKNNISLSICILDIITGESKIMYSYDSSQFIELVQCTIKMYNPKEIVIFQPETIKSNYFNIQVNFFTQNYTLHSLKDSEELLSRIFTSDKTKLLNPIEYIGLDKYPDCLNNFISTIKYGYQCNEKIVDYLKIPEVYNDSKYTYINSNCITNLDLIYLEKILNKCITNQAKREFSNRFYKPLQDLNIINNRLDKIEYFKDLNCNQIIEYLKLIKDLHLLNKKIHLNINDISIISFCLKNIYISIKNLYSLCLDCYIDISKFNNSSYDFIKLLKNILDYFESYFDYNLNIDKILLYYIKDKLNQDLYYLNNKFHNSIIINDFKPEFCNDSWYITGTLKKTTKDAIKDKNTIVINHNKDYTIKDFDITINKSSIKLYNKDICTHFRYLNNKINKYIEDYYKIFIKDIKYTELFENNIDIINSFIIEIDISLNNYINSIQLKYFRPKFNTDTHFSIKNIRHPIIEYNNKNTIYIKNDILFEKNGILLYGINSIGKSSLIKSIGICIIMAQIGMYVPSDEYNVYIIDKILTRFPSRDNLINNKSSFILEIEDIRDILKYSTKNTIVLADEICQNTETYSGISIISSTIDYLLNIKCKFIIATHLQELIDLEFINKNTKLDIYHLSITQKGSEFIFDRKLKKGPFHSLYGLEICKSLNLPNHFLKFAESIRQQLLSDTSITKLSKSRYNSDVYYKNKCQICNNNNKNTKFHIHHIIEQEKADSKGYIGLIHKNDKFNLVTLCEKCHHNVHNNELKIYGYIFTTNGIKLNFVQFNKLEKFAGT